MSGFLKSIKIFLIILFVGLSTHKVFSAETKLPHPKVGELAPDFSLKDHQGRVWKLSQFRGNVVILNFWATWCPPCVQEIPSMDFLNQYLKAKPISVLAVSVDKSWAEIKSFWSQLSRPPGFLTLLDADRAVATGLYGAEKFPESYVIDQEGRILRIIIGATNWADEALFADLEGILNKASSRNQEKKLKTE